MTPNTEALPPLPGGIRLTVTERCELDDWRHESIRIALARAALAQRQQVPVARLEAAFHVDDFGVFVSLAPRVEPLTDEIAEAFFDAFQNDRRVLGDFEAFVGTLRDAIDAAKAGK